VPRHKLLLSSLALALALGLAACGGGGESDEDEVANAIETAATSTDPSTCTELVTLAFNDQTEDGEGKAATKECEEDAEDDSNNPESVDVTKVEVDGSSATADAAFTGGSFDGQTLGIELVEENGDWKLDQITGFTQFDKAKLVAAISTGLEEQEEIEPELASCMVEIFEEAEEEEFEELILGGSSRGFVEIAEACQSQ
jgi:ABC-type glycerol-3-phosphate transport system substrate-binding protein